MRLSTTVSAQMRRPSKSASKKFFGPSLIRGYQKRLVLQHRGGSTTRRPIRTKVQARLDVKD